MPLRQLDVVVVQQLFTRPDGLDRLDEDLITLAHRLAIRRARMIEPPRRIATGVGVDHMFVIDLEQKGVVLSWAFIVVGVAAIDGRPRNDFALVLDQARSFWYRLQGKPALAVNAGSPDDKEPSGWFFQSDE